MLPRLLNGDQAMAHGALAGGVKMVMSYPGSPGSGTVETLIELAQDYEIYVEWSSNEKVAMEMGIGASIAGRRVLVCVKSVGMNAMIDPMMALNLTPVNGGLVILLGDDPGAYGSQNDQDTRLIANMLEMPMLEPAGPAEAYALMREAFNMSEKYQTAVIVRETRSFTLQREAVSIQTKPLSHDYLDLVKEPFRFVPVPQNAVEKHRQLHKRLRRIGEWADQCAFNKMIGEGEYGVVGAGFAYSKLLDVLGTQSRGDLRILKLSVLYPLPEELIARFLKGCVKLLVFEENEPYVEAHIKSMAQDLACRTKVFGKQSRHVPRAGELYRWQIQAAMEKFLSEFVPGQNYLAENEQEEIPLKESFCGGCGYDAVLNALQEAARDLGTETVVIADPGCLVTVADRIDAKYAMGSAVGVADGMSKAGIDERAVAMFGDSSFFHTSLPAICNAVHNKSNILMVILDNQATAATGFQSNPGVSKNALGKTAPALSMTKIAQACGVRYVRSVGPEDLDLKLADLFRDALSQPDLSLVVVRLKPRLKGA